MRIMENGLTTYVFVCIYLLGMFTVHADHCMNYTELSNTTLQASVSALGVWYRFISTPSGLIATACPDDDTCTNPAGVIWVNGTDGNATMCVKNTTGCCSNKTSIQMKMCDGYAVYLLAPLQAAYCFNTSETIPTVSPDDDTNGATGYTSERFTQPTQTTIGRQTSRGPKPQTTIKTTVIKMVSSDWPVTTQTTNITTTHPPEVPEDEDDKTWLKITIVVAVIVVIVLLGVARFVRWRMVQKKEKKAGVINPKPVVDISRKTSTV